MVTLINLAVGIKIGIKQKTLTVKILILVWRKLVYCSMFNNTSVVFNPHMAHLQSIK